MSPLPRPRCVITVSDVQPPAVTLQFSHRKYATLYREFLDRTATDDGSFTYTCPVENNDMVITILSTGSAAPIHYVEGNPVFASEKDAQAWEKRMALCRAPRSSNERVILRELRGRVYKKKLQISEKDWDKAWEEAVLVGRPRISIRR